MNNSKSTIGKDFLSSSYFFIVCLSIFFVIFFVPDFSSNTLLRVVYLGVLCLLIGIRVFMKNYPITNIFAFWFFSFVIIVTLLSLNSINKTGAISTIETISFNLIAIYAISLSIRTNKDLNMLITIMNLSLCFLTIYILWKYRVNLINLEQIYFDPFDEVLWNANNVGPKVAIGASLAFYQMLVATSKQHKLILGAIILISFFTLIFIASKQSLLFFINFVIIMIIFYSGKKRLLKGIIAIVIGGIVFLLLMKVPVLYDIIGHRFASMLGLEAGVDFSTSIRLDLIKNGLYWFSQKPFIGYGSDSFVYLYYSLTGYKYYAHNTFLELLVNFGIIGFSVYIFIYVMMFYNIKKSKTTKGDSCFVLAMLFSIIIIDMVGVNYARFYITIVLYVLYKKSLFVKQTKHTLECNTL